MLFVRMGLLTGEFEGVEEERVCTLFAGSWLIPGGWFSGWLDIDLTTLGRSWAEVVSTPAINIKSNSNANRYEIFFKLFKTSTPG